MPKQKFSDEELEAIVDKEIAASITYDRTILSKKRQTSVEYIRGVMTEWPAEKNRSSIVDMTLMETHGWMLPAIVRTFTASDRMAICEPTKEGQDEWAEQATVGVNHNFWKVNDGYQILYDGTYDSLLHGDGYIKHWFDDTPEVKISFHSGLTDDELAALEEPEDDSTDENGEPLETIEVLDKTTQEYTLEPGDEGYDDYGPSAGLMAAPPAMGGQAMGGPPMPPMPSAEAAGGLGGQPPPDYPPGGGAPAAPPQAPPSLSQPIQQSPMPPMGGPPQVPPPSAGLPPPSAMPPPLPPQPKIELRHSVKIKRTCRYGTVRLACIAPEDIVISDETTDIRKARLIGNKEQKTRSELIQMGFDRKKVDVLVPDTEDETIKASRATDETIATSVGVATEAMELITLYELYLKIDMDDDGIAETLQIYYGGYGGTGQLLEWNLWEDEAVYSNIPAYRIPHRQNADSLFDRTKDVQEIKTVLERQTLDSLYAATNPQKVVVGRCLNPDELTNPSFGGTILMAEGGSVTSLVTEFVGATALQGIEFFNNVVEKRTGVSRQTMALDPEALQNQTATAAQLGHDAGYTQIELITRNHAELGWTYVFRAVLKLMVRHQQRKSTIRLTGKKWATIDPRHWNADMDITINTGLGTGSRDRDMGMLQQTKADQVSMMMLFKEAQMPDKALLMVPKILNSLRKGAEAAGVKNVDDYYPEVDQQDLMQAMQMIMQKSAQPSPEMQQAQLLAQVEQGKAQAAAQTKLAEIQAKQQADQAEMVAKTEQQRLQSEVQVRREQAQLEADLRVKEADRLAQAEVERKKADLEKLKLAEASRQADLDRQQQWDIEVMKINAANKMKGAELGIAMDDGDDSKPTIPVTAADVALKGLNEVVKELKQLRIESDQPAALEGLKAMIEQLKQLHSAPKRIVRDQTGRAVGVETVDTRQ